MDRFAKVISTIGTSPAWVGLWLSVLGLIFLRDYGNDRADFVGVALLGVWTFSVGMYLRKRLDLNNKDRKFRSYFLIAMIAGWLFVTIVYWSNFSQFVRDALIIALITIIILLINNIYYRISFHVSLSTSLLILINHFSDWKFWIWFLIVPLIGWSRVYLKKHTLVQVIAGFLVPFLVYFSILYLELLK